MKSFPLIISIVTVILLVGSVLFYSSKSSTPQFSFPPSSYEYLWGDTCPHCEKVEEFLSSWDKKDQVIIDKYEVFSNKNNAPRLTQRAKDCQIPQNQVGVPLLITPQGECLVGDESIINHFKNLN